ncbi:uncharacterized protein FOMMEDRAFT_103735 [Fomitiporia mediterranea MF3/22]|uniref:uncharacterized protein n=1 Tax=Fomitiporia mediterranea (strain MF3/22) TaxID=694068 RepID=UPI0004407C7A|nr:uncharacterized protein FOMMEDRAFT_103735 [Fomitiporia mediterranea MF3/22]EJD05607.1 hypothetical protein FOMMEDRAFT_103735 [Fomitiporia mediterranea MF3/22]
MTEASPLGPIDPSSVSNTDQQNAETEKKAPWIVRKLVGSMTGRIVMSSYESLRAAGTSVVCLSPWGDSSPVFLPCIRFRDLVVHAVIAGTGGVAAVAAPVMGPVSDIVVDTVGTSLLVDITLNVGFSASTKLANDLLIEHTIKHIIPAPSSQLQTTGLKQLLVTLKYKHTLEDAQLGFFRSSVHEGDPGAGLFADVKDYLATEKGWFNPYLFASGRRPIIPRYMKPDVVFCHGPFLEGDYKIGTMLLHESESAIFLCEAPPSEPDSSVQYQTDQSTPSEQSLKDRLHIPSLSKYLPRSRSNSRSPSPEPALAPVQAPPRPRRLVVLVLAIAPHRAGMWTTSARPGESALRYTLLNGCPALVLPARAGAPLIAWDTLTLGQLHALGDELPSPEPESDTTPTGVSNEGGPRFRGALDILNEYIGLCVDWERVRLDTVATEQGRKDAVRNALALLLIAAICSKDSKQVKKDVEIDRAGLVIFRIP